MVFLDNIVFFRDQALFLEPFKLLEPFLYGQPFLRRRGISFLLGLRSFSSALIAFTAAPQLFRPPVPAGGLVIDADSALEARFQRFFDGIETIRAALLGMDQVTNE